MTATRQVGVEQQTVLVLDDDLLITEALAAGLERSGRTVITCNDLESAQLIVERLSPSHIVSDVRLSGPFGFEGLDFIRFAKRHSPQSRIILMTGDAPEALQLEASERGAVAFLQKPFQVSELDSVLDLMISAVEPAPGIHAGVMRMPLLDEILESEELRPVFQPIVKLTQGYPALGYEALARYRVDSPMRNPEVLFQYATRKQRITELELVCSARSIAAGAELANSGLLFLNTHPAVFQSGRMLRDTLLHAATEAGVHLNRIVLEITEQDSLGTDREVFKVIEDLQSLGLRFAFDDVGIAYSHLPLIDKVRPSFLKISQQFGTAFETDSTRTKIVKNILSLAKDFNCDLILEGIEHASTADAAQQLGIHYGQGYFFGRPADATTFTPLN